LGIDRYVTYHSGADLGEFVQTISSPLTGFGDTAEGGSHFLHHFSPLLYLCSPLLLIFRTPIVLIALQAVAAALVAPPVFLFARRRMPDSLAALVAVVALIYPPLVGVAFTDFHENGFAAAAIAWLIWAVDARRYALAALFVAIALAIKEDEALILFVLAIGFAIFSLRRGDRTGTQLAIMTAMASAMVLLAFFALIRPLAGAHGTWFAINYYEGHASDAPHGAAIVLGRVAFLAEALLPLASVPLATLAILLAVPGLVEVLASRWPITYTMGQHYAGVWIGEMLIAFAFGVAAIFRRNAGSARMLVRISIVLCLLNLAVASPTHWAHFLGPKTTHDRALDALLARIPPAASVATYDEVYAHLGFDPNAQMGFEPNPFPQYALFDARYDSVAWRRVYRPRLDALLRDGRYRPLVTIDGATLYAAGQGRTTALQER